ncbi:unnamed protein product, partial [Strongylus vulgaris]
AQFLFCFAVQAPFYNCTAQVWKGRVSADVELYVLPPSTETTRPNTDRRLEFWIRENAPYGSVVGQIPNNNDGNAATYSIIGNSDLSVDPRTGILKTATLFDYETQQLYTFKLRTTYASGESVDQNAILLIDDENDNIPKFDRETYNVTLREDIGIGEELLRLQWSDKDFSESIFDLSIIFDFYVYYRH